MPGLSILLPDGRWMDAPAVADAAAAADAVLWPFTPVGPGCAISWTGSASASPQASRRPSDSLIS